MLTAIDSSILIDVLIDDKRFAEASVAALRRARQDGALIVSETVVAEVTPVLAPRDAESFWREWSLRFVPMDFAASRLAGKMYAGYLKKGGTRKRVVADFLVGAHAQNHADRLLTRDRGYYREYFRQLKIWEP